MSTKDTPKCSARVTDDTGYHHYPCSRKGTVQEDGNPWCKQHAPSSKKARREASHARFEARMERLDAPDREIERLEAINHDLLAALKAATTLMAEQFKAGRLVGVNSGRTQRVLAANLAAIAKAEED